MRKNFDLPSSGARDVHPLRSNEAGEGRAPAEKTEAGPAGAKPSEDEIANLKAELTAMQARRATLRR